MLNTINTLDRSWKDNNGTLEIAGTDRNFTYEVARK